MSEADYYFDQGIQEMADQDNEMDRLERIAQAKALDDRVKKLIQQQAKLIIESTTSANNKIWIEWIDELFRIRFSNGEIETKPYIAITYGEWQKHRKEVLKKVESTK